MATATVIMSVLFGVSEALSLIPQVKANGVFQAVYGFFRLFKGGLLGSK